MPELSGITERRNRRYRLSQGGRQRRRSRSGHQRYAFQAVAADVAASPTIMRRSVLSRQRPKAGCGVGHEVSRVVSRFTIRARLVTLSGLLLFMLVPTN